MYRKCIVLRHYISKCGITNRLPILCVCVFVKGRGRYLIANRKYSPSAMRSQSISVWDLNSFLTSSKLRKYHLSHNPPPKITILHIILNYHRILSSRLTFIRIGSYILAQFISIYNVILFDRVNFLDGVCFCDVTHR